MENKESASIRLRHPSKYLGKKVVVVVGGGFAGLTAAKQFANRRDTYVILVDERNHHLFQPLLYQVATAGLNPADIAVPIRAQFSRTKNIEVHKVSVSEVDLEQKVVRLPYSEIEFDYVVLACGAQHSYFSNPEWEEHAPGLKSLEQATEIRRRILSAFEKAESELDANRQRAFLTFVVIGGGPTGVEMAGAISDISRTVLLHDFRRIDPSQAKVVLLEAGPRVLAAFSEDLSKQTMMDLHEIGVEVRTSARVTHIDKYCVQVGSEVISSRTKIWAAGVQASKMAFTQDIKRDRAGRIQVNKDLSIPDYPFAFVVGDMAACEMAPGKTVPGLAPAAIQQGRHVAKVILASIYQRQRPSFQYVDKGQMATIGKNRAVANTGTFKMTGYIAWLAWLFVHVFYMIGFKNRFSVMAQWGWSYIFSKRGTRLITEKGWKLKT
ncbi:NAD(P)/FAD-dependent oxidoreductase [Bdellovibrio sp. HCB337]|uniref:NAD(P)/FAD-dependent oxidoreductase n=1 Tax=Bdellovibrio sp. HCB337 TaxID=3394358 RepID=UPI0039A59D5E